MSVLDKTAAEQYIVLLKEGRFKEPPLFGPFWCYEKHYHAKGLFIVERFSEGEKEKPLEFSEEEFQEYIFSFSGAKAERVVELLKNKI